MQCVNSQKTGEGRGCGGREQIKCNHRRNILLLLDGESEGGIRARSRGHFPTRLSACRTDGPARPYPNFSPWPTHISLFNEVIMLKARQSIMHFQ